MESSSAPFTSRFEDYFKREVAERAARTLADGVEMELQIQGSDGSLIETMTFTRVQGKNQVHLGAPQSPQVVFKITPLAADQILNNPSEEIGQIGVQIAKLVFSPDANLRVSAHFKVGFFAFFTKGYLGVLTAGGAEFGAYLASRGLNGINAIKAVLNQGRK